MTEEFDFEAAMGQIKSEINDDKTFSMALRRGLIVARNISSSIPPPYLRSAQHLKLDLCHFIWDREIVSDDIPSWMGEYGKANAIADPGEKVVDQYKFQAAQLAARSSADEAIKIIANIEKEGAPPTRTEQPPTRPKPPTETKAAMSAKPALPFGPSSGTPPPAGDTAPPLEASEGHPERRPEARPVSSQAHTNHPPASSAASAAPARRPAGLGASIHNFNRPRPPPTALPDLDSTFGAMPRNWDEVSPELPPAPPAPIHGGPAPILNLPIRGDRRPQGSSRSAAKAPPSRRGDVAARTNDDDGLWVGRDGNPLPNLPGCKGSDIPLPAGVEPDRILTAETKDKLSRMLGVFLKIVREGSGPNRNAYKLRIQEHHALEGLPREFRRHLRVRAHAVLADALRKSGVQGQLLPLVEFVAGWFQSRTDEFASDSRRLAEQMAGRDMYPSGLKIPSSDKPQTAALGSYVKDGAGKPSSAAGGATDGRPTKDDLRKALEGVWAAHAAAFSGIPEGKRSGLAERFASLAFTRGSVFTVPGMLQSLEQKVMWPERMQIQLSSRAEEHELVSKLCCYFVLEVLGVVPAEERGKMDRWIQRQVEEFREAFEGHKAQLARHSSEASAAMNARHTVEDVSIVPVGAAGARGDGKNQRFLVNEILVTNPAAGSAPPDSDKGEGSRKESEEAEAQGENKWVEVKEKKANKPKKGGK
ncbi:hypothetical protein DL768_009572 [Monosporascus sp. mg162]|nr:hypothetical protein DL768_009572 [Monosporascus sp. mg162]